MAMTVRADDELDRALEALARAVGLSKREVVRRAVLERFERAGHRTRVDGASERTIERSDDVLDRLGKV